MKTEFSPEQLREPALAEANKILRSCVHCGFCTATCPTFLIRGDELDSPRGRIYLIKDMLEQGRPADAKTVTHIDRCLGCLACMTTCPSGVHYAHLLEIGKAHIEATYRRPWHDRALRWLLAQRDARGLSYIAQGDWCDPMNMVGWQGRGVSGWLSLASAHALRLWARICARRGRGAEAAEFEAGAAEFNAAVNARLWDGDWYARGITDDGVAFGVAADP